MPKVLIKSPLAKISQHFSHRSRLARPAKTNAQILIKKEAETETIKNDLLNDDKVVKINQAEEKSKPTILVNVVDEPPKVTKVDEPTNKVKYELKERRASVDTNPEVEEIQLSDNEGVEVDHEVDLDEVIVIKDEKKTKDTRKNHDQITKLKPRPKPKSKPKPKEKKKEILDDKQPKITDFLRRSSRVPQSQKRKIEEKQLFIKLDSTEDDNLPHMKIKITKEKGRGIYATRSMQIGEFVVEYAGDLLSMEDGKLREVSYSEDASIGSYIYFFEFQGAKYCIDATKESGRYGRLLNHSKLKPNCKTRLVEYPDGIPRLLIEVKKPIKKDEELLYDYGDRSEKSLKIHPWLKE